jgi:hypothetical protein
MMMMMMMMMMSGDVDDGRGMYALFPPSPPCL